LVGGRKRDREINHEGLGADICNGLKLKKSECADFSPCSLFNDLSRAPALSAAKQSLRTAVERLKRLERLELLERLEPATAQNVPSFLRQTHVSD